ncbi:MAG: hypothetical protein WCB11_29980 [Terriglobales bacterium]|jgi:hypothetical protein
MSTTARPSPTRVAHWQQSYQAALFETDERELPARIAEAERAIAQRAQELFNSNTDSIEEDEALEDALYGLQALQNSQAREKQAA